MTCPIARIFLLLREHIEQNTPNEDKKIVDLFTQEEIDRIRLRMNERKQRKNKEYKYIPYNNPNIDKLGNYL